MDSEKLKHLDEKELADFVWRRLRLEPPVDPPPGTRFGQEPPEQFLIATVEQSGDRNLRRRLIEATDENLKRLAGLRASSSAELWDDPVVDEQLASLAFLASSLQAEELLPTLHLIACSRGIGDVARKGDVPSGEFHILKALARLQKDRRYAGLWESLWQSGPRSIRGLTIFGWARADPEQALTKLGELADMKDEIDLPATVWSLVGPDAPGVFEVGRAARRCSSQQREALRQALAEAGADESTLRDFDLQAGPPTGGDTGFPFRPSTAPANPSAARVPLQWAEAA